MTKGKWGRDSNKNSIITIRLSSSDMTGLNKIQSSGDFEEMSSTLRWCIHFTVAMLRVIPAAVIEAFMETESQKNDQMEKGTNEVPNKTEIQTEQV